MRLMVGCAWQTAVASEKEHNQSRPWILKQHHACVQVQELKQDLAAKESAHRASADQVTGLSGQLAASIREVSFFLQPPLYTHPL